MIWIFAESINNSKAPVSAVGGWPKALAMVAMIWTIGVAVWWLVMTLIRAHEVITRHRGDPDWE